MTIEISLCMIMKDEEDQIARCITSARPFVDEIIIGDTGSTDRSVAIARELGATVIDVDWQHDFAAARNQVLQRAQGAWILQLDADEALAGDSAAGLRQAIQTNAEGYWCEIRSYVGAEESPSVSVTHALRLFKRKYRYQGAIHEEVTGGIKAAGGRVEHAPLVIWHWGYLQGQMARKQKADRNLKQLLAQLERDPENPSLHYYLGTEYHNRGEWAQALEHLGFLTPAHLEAWGHGWVELLKAECLMNLGRTREACAMLSGAITQHPGYTDLYYARACGWAMLGRGQQALADLNKCLTLGEMGAPYKSRQGVGTWLPLTLTGGISGEAGQLETALSFLSRALRANPRFEPAVLEVVRFSEPLPVDVVCDFLLAHVDGAWLAERLAAQVPENERAAQLLGELKRRHP